MTQNHGSSKPQGGPNRRKPNSQHREDISHAERPAHAIVCDDCGLVLHDGRWQRGGQPSGDVKRGVCPACERTKEKNPAGTLRLPAAFLEIGDELEGLLRNAEEAEGAEHPLERIMGMDPDEGGGMIVTTTGVHLARRLANKLERRFHRQAEFDFADGVERLRVFWPEE